MVRIMVLKKDYIRTYYQRNNKTTFNRFSLATHLKPFQFGGQHTLSFKAFAGQRKFENINNDQFLMQMVIWKTEVGLTLHSS